MLHRVFPVSGGGQAVRMRRGGRCAPPSLMKYNMGLGDQRLKCSLGESGRWL